MPSIGFRADEPTNWIEDDGGHYESRNEWIDEGYSPSPPKQAGFIKEEPVEYERVVLTVTAGNAGDFDKEMNKAIAEGYSLYGNPFSNKSHNFVQVMIKHKRKEI